MEMRVNGTPVPKPRMTKRDKWMQRDCVVRYRAWADLLRAEQMKARQEIPSGPLALHLVFYMPYPRTKPPAFPVHKPDLSNLVKAVEDALIPDDQRVVGCCATKTWATGQVPGVYVRISAVP